jgi:hypothetical protein
MNDGRPALTERLAIFIVVHEEVGPELGNAVKQCQERRGSVAVSYHRGIREAEKVTRRRSWPARAMPVGEIESVGNDLRHLSRLDQDQPPVRSILDPRLGRDQCRQPRLLCEPAPLGRTPLIG